MKNVILFLYMAFGLTPLFAQERDLAPDRGLAQEYEKEEKVSITVGILQGGGSLVGADIEFLLSSHLGFQVGAGFRGYGAGLNIHLKPSIRSSFVSLAYWHQGIGETHAQTVMGPTFVYRSRKWFTTQLGLGFPLEKGPAWPSELQHPPVMLMYSIGAYFPL